MNLTIEQPCPQCGGPVELGEADHVLICPYCGTKNFLSTSMPALLLPPAREYAEMIYVPYLRFRGSVFSCIGNTIQHQVTDTSLLGTPLNILPPSLGIRPQAMKIHFATDKLQGTFLKCFHDAGAAVERAGSLQNITAGQTLYHRAYIGETLSLIYQPLYLKDKKLGDAITGKPLARLKGGLSGLDRVTEPTPPLDLNFLATLCPQCGWDLNCTCDSIVLTCPNCHTAWKAAGKRFSRVDCTCMECDNKQAIYLPFWKMAVDCRGIRLENYADLARLANLPRKAQPEWKERKLVLWSPAFKVRPKIFLRLAGQCSTLLEESDGKKMIPANSHPVNLPLSEAIESLKVILAGLAVNKKKLLPMLADIRISVTSATLFYLPFDNTGYDLRQTKTGISINKQILARGKDL